MGALLLTPEEVAKRYQVKETTVRRWVRNGWITAIDIGGGERVGPYRFREADLMAFEESRLRKSVGG